MLWAGYGYKDREIVTRRILAKVENDRKSNVLEGRPYYRSKAQRKQVLKTDKATWFRDKGATATLMVPTTQGSTLAKRLREVVAKVLGLEAPLLKL